MGKEASPVLEHRGDYLQPQRGVSASFKRIDLFARSVSCRVVRS
jgi:hypothetical protein